MSTFLFGIPEVYRAVSRPVAFDVLRRLIPIWGLDVDKTRIVMRGETETIPVTNSALQSDPRSFRLPNDVVVEIDVIEDFSQNVGAILPTRRKEFPSIIKDNRIGLDVRPVYREVDVEINVTLKHKNRVMAKLWRRDLQARLSTMAVHDQHYVNYHYALPDGVNIFLMNIHKHREENHAYGENCGTWLVKNSSNRLAFLDNQGGKGNIPSIREQQIGITGYYDFETPPQPEATDAGTLHTYTFTYKYSYMRPDHILMTFPIAIHNRMLPSDMIDKSRVKEVENWLTIAGWSYSKSIELKYHNWELPRWNMYGGVPVPYYDDWVEFHHPKHMTQIMRILMTVYGPDPNLVFDLQDLGDWEINPRVINYMKRRPLAITRAYDSIVHINLWKWNQLIDQDTLTVDSDLVVRVTNEMTPRDNWHFTINMVTDPTLLSKEAIEDLVQDGELCKDYLNICYPGIGDKLPIYPDGTTRVIDFWSVFKPNPFNGASDRDWMRYILYAGIIAHRRR